MTEMSKELDLPFQWAGIEYFIYPFFANPWSDAGRGLLQIGDFLSFFGLTFFFCLLSIYFIFSFTHFFSRFSGYSRVFYITLFSLKVDKATSTVKLVFN
jgi:hypothetical protein